MALSLSRHKGEKIFIDTPSGRIEIMVVKTGPEACKLDFVAPLGIMINRAERASLLARANQPHKAG
jgi:sRNA-binding carbon storage regulator CsrA